MIEEGCGIVIGVIHVGSMATAMALTANRENKEELKLPEELTKEDLQKLYKKYNITENDINFAEGKLPHYLKGTLLDGKVVTMGKVTKDGRVENWIDPLFFKWCMKNGYKVIPARKAIEVEEKARKDYIKKYGVDPANPKLIYANGVPLPAEYVKELVRNGKLKPEQQTGRSSNGYGCDDDPYLKEGPWAVNDKLYLWIVRSKDCNKPYESYLQDTINAWSRFYQFGVDHLYYYKIYYMWSTCDVFPWWSTSELLKDLKDDLDWLRYEHNDENPKNDILIGWVYMGDHNGKAYCNGYESVAATQTLYGINWPHDSIAQHEISHNFNAADDNCEEECIMDYWDAFWGTDEWCSHHWCVVYGNVNGVWEDCLI